MPCALALSPHLDDAVFSCGGLLAQLADAGWHVCLATAFTATRAPVEGFALACQLDKGLPAEVDYMALRRSEDRDAAVILGVTDVRHLDLPEAPHRGYESASALFGDVRPDDDAWRPLADLVCHLRRDLHPALVLAPQGLGSHVDHRQMIRAVLEVVSAEEVTWYRDTPYAMRNPAAFPDHLLPPLPSTYAALRDGELDRKVEAACAYASQVGFQFGGAEAAGRALRRFAASEGASESDDVAAERFMAFQPYDGFLLAPRTSHSQDTM